MAKLKPAQIAEVKGKGFLINRGTENFFGKNCTARNCIFSGRFKNRIGNIK